MTVSVNPATISPSISDPGDLGTASDTVGKVQFELQIAETDVRAKQFACKLVFVNNTKYPIDILAINYRLGYGVSMQRSENTSTIDLSTEYEFLRKDVRELISANWLVASSAYRKALVDKMYDTLKQNSSLRNAFKVYYWMATLRLRQYARDLARRIEIMEFPVSSASAARTIIDGAWKDDALIAGTKEILSAKLDRMEAIEELDPNTRRAEYLAQLAPGEELERIYIIKAGRKFSSIASYTVAFDTKVGWTEPKTGSDGRRVERVMSRSSSFSVTPSPITLSIFAVFFSLLGVLLTLITKAGDQASGLQSFQQAVEFAALKQYTVAAILSLVLYNSLEMTDFKDRIKSISWRSAMFVGILCGLLSDKMLQAITAFAK